MTGQNWQQPWQAIGRKILQYFSQWCCPDWKQFVATLLEAVFLNMLSYTAILNILNSRARRMCVRSTSICMQYSSRTAAQFRISKVSLTIFQTIQKSRFWIPGTQFLSDLSNIRQKGRQKAVWAREPTQIFFRQNLPIRGKFAFRLGSSKSLNLIKTGIILRKASLQCFLGFNNAHVTRKEVCR